MRISDWSSDVCSSDLEGYDPGTRRCVQPEQHRRPARRDGEVQHIRDVLARQLRRHHDERVRIVHQLGQSAKDVVRSEEHTSELQSLMRTSYAVICLKTQTIRTTSLRHTKNKKQ